MGNLFPIGQLSEGALEARHTECRYFREHNNRKISRKQNIEDLLHALRISPDPLISSMRSLPKMKINQLPQQIINILKVPKIAKKLHMNSWIQRSLHLSDEMSDNFSDNYLDDL